MKFQGFILSILLLFIVYGNTSQGREYHYAYKDRKHTKAETAKYIGILYAIGWGSYITQPTTYKEKGSKSRWWSNLGKANYDKDEPFWNWGVHTITGSQLYLLFRANGYERLSAFGYTFLQSILFEFATEIYTERASLQDLYNTPVLGSILGVGIENLSLTLLNSSSSTARFFGHLINPFTLFPFFEGKTLIAPRLNQKGLPVGINMVVNF